MKVVVFVKATEQSEAGVMPEQQLLVDMMNYNEELVKAGIMKSGDGLKPTKDAVRVRFSDTDRTVIDGPFAETKEVVAGYWIWEVENMDEAVAWVKKCPNPMIGDSDIDIRPVFEMEDFGEIVTPEIKQQEQRLNTNMQVAELPQRQLFVNLPVANLENAKAFYLGLGFTCNDMYTDNTAACIVISKDIYCMLLTHEKFQSFAPNPLADAHQSTEVLNALSCESKQEVDNLVVKATAHGGGPYSAPKDYGFMYQHGFQDIDGHVWELVYMSGETS